MNQVCVIGSGMLGKQMYLTLKQYYQVILYPHNQLDLLDKENLQKIIPKYDYIINCAAYTNVDKAQKQKQLCYDINVNGVKNLVDLCKKYQKKLIHFSSAFVYGDDCNRVETDGCNPMNYYGKTKLQADEYITLNLMTPDYLILRINWLFGMFGSNFIEKIFRQIEEGKDLIVVNDQIGIPTSCKLVCKVTKKYIDNYLKGGLYNLQCMGVPVFKSDIAEYLVKLLNKNNKITKVHTDNSGEIYAKRPLNTVMNCLKIDNQNIFRSNWDEQVVNYLNEIEFTF